MDNGKIKEWFEKALKTTDYRHLYKGVWKNDVGTVIYLCGNGINVYNTLAQFHASIRYSDIKTVEVTGNKRVVIDSNSSYLSV